MKKVLVTGGAGFIGFHLSKAMLEMGYIVRGFDNLNSYYDPALKKDRLEILENYPEFSFTKGDLAERTDVESVFDSFCPDIVINLGAQAGVRYSIENPTTYMESNIIGFFNVLECCRASNNRKKHPVEHLIFASSSSVYGNQEKVPFSVEDPVDRPISLYAATKKSNELMGYTYSHLYGIPMTGLRFFTVYGPYGRPDMAYFSFAEKIMRDEVIQVFNDGDLYRDFTYIDDIVTGILNMLESPPDGNDGGDRYKIYNIGNHKPENLMDFIHELENALGKKARMEFLPMQAGDVYQTYADVSDLERDFQFSPKTSLKEGLNKFAEWYLNEFRKRREVRHEDKE